MSAISAMAIKQLTETIERYLRGEHAQTLKSMGEEMISAESTSSYYYYNMGMFVQGGNIVVDFEIIAADGLENWQQLYDWDVPLNFSLNLGAQSALKLAAITATHHMQGDITKLKWVGKAVIGNAIVDITITSKTVTIDISPVSSAVSLKNVPFENAGSYITLYPIEIEG